MLFRSVASFLPASPCAELTWRAAGTGVGLLNEERPAEVIVREIEQDALRGLEQLSQLLVQ